MHYRPPYATETACGLGSDITDWYTPNKKVECGSCIDSDLYQDHLFEFEIGFDGNEDAWYSKFDNENSEPSTPF